MLARKREERELATGLRRRANRISAPTPASMEPSPSKSALKAQIASLEEHAKQNEGVISTLTQQATLHDNERKAERAQARQQRSRLRTIQGALLGTMKVALHTHT